jgi:hypothetical protein
MTTKPHSGLAASGPADDPESDQITKEHNEDDPSQDINIDPSEDVTVEAAEDVTTEAAGQTPPPSFRDSGGASPGQRAPTLMGVPIQSLPLPGVTATSNGESTRTIDYDEEVTVLADPKAAAPSDPLAILDQFDRPSITDDDEEETKVEPAEAAMKAAASIDDVSTALSTQASLEREKALRRSVPAASPSDDLEFADPEADDERAAEPQAEEEESLDDELSDEDEVISAGGAIEEEEDIADDDEDDGVGDGVATATFMKPIDSTGLSGLLNPRRPPTGGRDGFGSRLPTPYPPPQMAVPAPSTSPFASRLGPAPIGSPYGARATGTAMPALQVPPPSGAAATTASEPGFFTKRLAVPGYALIALVGGSIFAGFGLGGLFLGKSAPPPAVVVAKPAAVPAAPAPVVEPVAGSAVGATAETKPAAPVEAVKAAAPAGEVPGATQAQAGASLTEEAADQGLAKPAKKAATKPHKPVVDPIADDEGTRPAVAISPKPATPKPAIEKAPKLASAPAAPKPTAGKPAKKPAKVWVDPFAQ